MDYDSNDKVKFLTHETDKVEITPGINVSTLEIRDGKTIKRLYFHNSNYHIRMSEMEGFPTSYDYNSHGLVTTITYPMGNEHRFVYDENNLPGYLPGDKREKKRDSQKIGNGKRKKAKILQKIDHKPLKSYKNVLIIVLFLFIESFI